MVAMTARQRDVRAKTAAARRTLAAALWLGAMGTTACVAEPVDDVGIEPRDAELPLQPPVPGLQVPAPLPGAHCQIQVEGQGLLDMETDYLAHVITCENGGANLEALKAQAISARSVAYYAIETSGGICDSQGCQVYSCAATPQPIHYQAVEETSGVYLMYNNTLTYGFYVAGDNSTAPPACVGVSGSTEGWVTYNEGRTGTNVEQTALGFIHDPSDFGYGQNRGCMSQWGARCLDNDVGYDYLDILRFYYGDDIETIQAEGDCVIPQEEETSTTGDPPAGEDTAGEDTVGQGQTSGGLPPGGPTSGGEGPPPGGTAGAEDPEVGEQSTAGPDGPALPTTFGQTDQDGGCACRSTPSSTPRPWAGLLLLLGLRRVGRRRRR